MLNSKIINKKARVGVVGLGYVGLPLAMLCGQKGYQVIGIDNDEKKINGIKKGSSYITGVSDDQLKSLSTKGILQVVDDYIEAPCCDIVFVCVPTPLTNDYRPDYTSLYAVIDTIASNLKPQQLIIIESTITPGTTKGEILQRLEAGGLRAGRDFYLVFSPERIDPANNFYSLRNTPKLVAGSTSECQLLACQFYTQLGVPVVAVRTTEIAEMAKLLENTYRDVNIALINEVADVCNQMRIDIWEVIAAASTKPFGFQSFFPGPGVGGHCIPKDSNYFIYTARQKCMAPLLAEQARRINTSRPESMVKRLKEILSGQGKRLDNSKLMVLGVTYKKDVNDIRQSPVIKMIEILSLEGASVSYHDPFISSIHCGNLIMNCVDLTEDIVSQQDCIVLAVPHSFYNLYWLSVTCTIIFDLTNEMAHLKGEDVKIISL